MLAGAPVRLHAALSPRRVATTALGLGFFLLVGIAVGRGGSAYVGAAAAMAMGLALALTNWRWSVRALLVYLPFSGIPIILLYPNTAAPVLLKDFLFVIPAYVGFLVGCIADRRSVAFPGAPTVLFALLALLVVFQALNPALPNVLVGAIGVKVWLLYMPLYYLGYHYLRSKDDLFRLFGLMSLVALVPAVIGILEALLVSNGKSALVYSFYGDAAAATTQEFAQFNLESGGSIRRVSSTFSFVTQYYIFTAAMGAVAYAWWRGALAGTRRASMGRAVWLTMIAAAFLSGARGAFLLIPLLVVLMTLIEHGRVRLSPSRLVAPAAALLAAVAVFGSGAWHILSFAVEVGRQEFADVFVNGFRSAFDLTLVGLGTGADTNAARYAFSEPTLFSAVNGKWYESWYVKASLELGVAGLVLALLLLGTIVVRSWHSHRRLHDPRLRVVSASLIALLVWNLVYNVKGQYTDLDPMNVYFWLFAGMLAKLPQLDREES